MGRRADYNASLDSPSRQLVLDLAQELEQVRLHTQELKLVNAYERRSFYERLDQVDRKLEAKHNAALDQVAALHDKVREEAEQTLRDHLRAKDEERMRREEAERKKREQQEAELRRRQAEEEEKARLELKRKEEEEARRRIKEKEEEDARRERKAAEEAERERQTRQRQDDEKKKQEAERQRAKQEATESLERAQRTQQKALGASRLTEQEIKVHQRYLELHRHLKTFRKWLLDQSKTNPVLKQNMGDMRRTLKKCVGQLREGKGANRTQVFTHSNK